MPAIKKATKKTTSKKIVGKKSAAAAPIVKTKIIKSAETGEIVSKDFAKTHPTTTMAITVERPIAGAAKEAQSKAAKKSAHKPVPAKKSAPVSKPNNATLKKAAPVEKKATPTPLQKAKEGLKIAQKKVVKTTAAYKKAVAAERAAMRAPAKPNAVRAANKALDKVSKVAKKAVKAISNPNASADVIEREAGKLGTAVGMAIIEATHVADAKSARAPSSTAPKKPAAPVRAAVTPSQQLRAIGQSAFATAKPETPAQTPVKSNSPFNVEAVREVTRNEALRAPLIEAGMAVFR